MAEVKPIYLIGAQGFLGRYLQRSLSHLDVTVWPTSQLLDDPRMIEHFKPGIVINAGGLAQAAECLKFPELDTALNISLPARLGPYGLRGWRMVHLSTDCVFGGQGSPYRELSPALPLSRYGQSKLRGEDSFFAKGGNLIVRLSLLVGPSLDPARSGFFDQWDQKLSRGEAVEAFDDEFRSALLYPLAAECLASLALGAAEGLLLLGGSERLSRYEIGVRLARVLGLPDRLVLPKSRNSFQGVETRPMDLAMDCRKAEAWLPAHLRDRPCDLSRLFMQDRTIRATPAS